MGAYLENVLRGSHAANVTEFFLWILLATFIISLVLTGLRRARKFTAYTPNLLTSIGILGTFVGIVIGLMAFDPSDIDKSIPHLLDGLKTAFVTSLVGMGGSILYKVLSTLPWLNTNGTKTGDSDVGTTMIHQLQKQTEQLENLHKAIVGQEESSIAGQLKLFRSDARDQSDEIRKLVNSLASMSRKLVDTADIQRKQFDTFTIELWGHLKDFAEMLSKSATEQVINALKEVITDFNKNLTEQFGDNFKALDTSVKRLVEWQENYRKQLEQMGEQYAQGVKAITQTEASIAHISEASKTIPDSMQALGNVMTVNQHQIDELERHLHAFSDVRDKAVEALPQINQHIELMTSSVSNSVEQFSQGMLQNSEKMNTAIAGGIEEFENNVHRLGNNLTGTSDLLATQAENIRQQLADTVTDLNTHARQMIETLKQGSQDLVQDTLDINTAIKEATSSLEEETRSVQQKVSSSIEQMQKRLESTMEEVFQAQTTATGRAIEGVISAVEEVIKRTGDGVNTQITMIDEAMQKEISRVMSEMGNALAQITNQFTKDYTKLVTAMNKVVKQGVS